MFTRNSRYHGSDTVSASDSNSRPVAAVKLRRPGTPSGQSMTITDGDQLDVISKRRYRDPTRYWHIADANTELEADRLVADSGRRIQVPEK